MNEAPKFEDGLAALEKLVSEMETGDLGLDEALKRFEKGVKLAAQMQKSLEDTHRKIEQLGAADPKGRAGGGGEEDEEGAGGGEAAPRGARGSKPSKPGPPPTLF